jgi:hypothetical protein
VSVTSTSYWFLLDFEVVPNARVEISLAMRVGTATRSECACRPNMTRSTPLAQCNVRAFQSHKNETMSTLQDPSAWLTGRSRKRVRDSVRCKDHPIFVS